MFWCLLILGLFFSNVPAQAADPQMVVDLYGTQRVTEEELVKLFSKDLGDYHAKLRARAPGSAEEAGRLKADIESRAKAIGKFVWVGFDTLVRPPNVYVTFEFVEPEDAQTRLPFNQPPTSSISDPHGLIAEWDAYSERSQQLARLGDIGSGANSCPSFYCSWTSTSTELKIHERSFSENVSKNRDTLAKITRRDIRPTHRAAALYLLSYLRDGNAVVRFCQDALLDPDERIREAALRILADIALHHPQFAIPIESVCAALDFPRAKDRSLALALMLALADKEAYREALLRKAVPSALRILRLKHPENRQMAHTFLGLLSGENHPEADYDAWEFWAQRARAPRPAAEASKKRRFRIPFISGGR